MIFDNLIGIVKKLRSDAVAVFGSLHEDLANLSEGLKELKDAIKTQRESECKQPPVPNRISVTDFQAQVPIRVETETKRNQRERIWRVFKGAAEVVGIIAVVAYTVISYGQWEQASDGTNFAGRQTELSRKALNETMKNFRIDRRPMIQVRPVLKRMKPIENAPIEMVIEISNIGKTVARDVRGFVDLTTISVADNPATPQPAKNPMATLHVGAIFPQVVKQARIPMVEPVPGSVDKFHQATFTKKLVGEIALSTTDLEIFGNIELFRLFRWPTLGGILLPDDPRVYECRH